MKQKVLEENEARPLKVMNYTSPKHYQQTNVVKTRGIYARKYTVCITTEKNPIREQGGGIEKDIFEGINDNIL